MRPRTREPRVTTPHEFGQMLQRPLGELPDPLPMTVPGRSITAAIELPGSKSLTNRALLLALLAEGESVIGRPLLDADDAQVMLGAIAALGAVVTVTPGGGVQIRGCGGRLSGGRTLNLNNAGTATRFLTAAACLADAPIVIDGNARMRQRPIGELVGMLRGLGIQVDELGAPGCVPLRVHPARVAGGVLRVPTTLSSQFVSALMMVAPAFASGLAIEFIGAVTSPSYIEMTQGLMRRVCGIPVEGSVARGSVRVPAMAFPGFRYTVEPDASGATYFAAAAALLAGTRITLPGITAGMLQTDAAFLTILERCGAEVTGETDASTIVGTGVVRAVDADLSLMPDTAMTLAAVACFATGSTTIRGLRTLRVKETDRIAALACELGKINVDVEVFGYTGKDGAPDEGMRITPPLGGVDCSANVPAITFQTYDDHRMAMSLALVGLRRPHVQIADPGCVAKTYPGYWRDLARLYGAGPT